MPELAHPPLRRRSLTPIKFTLDFKFQGIHAWYYVAKEKGYFKAEGIDITIDQGEGSAATITRIMSGAYDAGFGDINAIIQQAANKPGEQPVMVYQIYNRPPFVIVTKANGPIKTLKDLEGKKLGGPAGSATLRLLPSFAKINKIDTSNVSILNMAPNLQEQMLSDRPGPGLAGVQRHKLHQPTAAEAGSGQGLPLVQLRRIRPRSLFQRRDGLAEAAQGEPEGGRRAGARHQPRDQGSHRQSRRRHRDAEVKVEPLLNADIEKKRIVYALNNLMNAPEAADLGIGDLKDDRLTRSIGVIVEAYELKRTPTASEVFNRSFLPPKADRQISIKTN